MRLTIKAAQAAFILLNLLPSSACPQAVQDSVKVDSYKIVSENENSVNIEFIVSNDGSLGLVCLNAVARASDGSARTESGSEIQLPIGQQKKVSLILQRPLGQDEWQTDSLIVNTSTCFQISNLQTIKFDWLHIWPKKTPQSFDGVYDEKLEFSSRNPWNVFQEHFDNKDFLAADQLLNKWNAATQRDKNGNWKLNSFLTALQYNFKQNQWKQNQVLINSWLSTDPKSVGGHLVEAAYWQYYALSLKKVSKTTEQDPVIENAFKARIKHAEKALIDSKAFASKNPLWYQIYLQILINADRDPLFIKQTFNEAIARHPYYLPLYFSLANSMVSEVKAPNWETANEIVELAVKQTMITDGNKNYAKLYSQLKDGQKIDFDILRLPYFSWGKMKASFEEIILTYPSAANYNNYAAFACLAGDKATYIKLRPIFSKYFIAYEWSDNYSIDVCDRKFLDYAHADRIYVANN